jgi:hypothetical protein
VLPRRLFRALLFLTAAALAGIAALAIAYASRPSFTAEMDRPMGAVLSGVYDSERSGDDTFAWTGRQATMTLPGLDRRGPWTCIVRLRGGRADPASLPEVTLSVDGVVTGRHATSNDFTEIGVPLAVRKGTGATITLTTPTFVPGGGDKRELGVYVDRWTCAPDPGFHPMPPSSAMRTAAIASAAFGSALLLMGAPVTLFAAGVTTMAGLQAIPLTRDTGLFSAFALPIEWLAVALAMVMGAIVLAGRLKPGRPMSSAAHVAVFVTLGALYLKLLALLHPSKPLIDALFHAHRLEWVLGGNYFFTQQMPSGVQFPYAIGLYVFSALWTMFTSDLVTLLRLVVTGAEAATGLLLYYLVARCWNDRFVAASAAALSTLALATFDVVGNANFTNAFGQSVAFAALAAATLWPLSKERWPNWVGLTLLIAFGLLCHISTLTLLSAVLGVLLVLYLIAPRPRLTREAWMIAFALVVAFGIATALYYRHFGDSFASALRVRATAATPAAATPAVPLMTRAVDVTRSAVLTIGWPLLLLAIPGAVAWVQRGWRDRLGLAIAALAITFFVFTTSVAVMPVERAFYRYALEFVTRVTLATYPAVVIWAALGAVTAWRKGGLIRAAGLGLVLAAIIVAGEKWMDWIR